MTFDEKADVMRAEWYKRKHEWGQEGFPDSGQAFRSWADIETKLRDHYWEERTRVVMKDRAAHPKAKRNQPLPPKVAPVEGEFEVPTRVFP